MTEKPKSAPPEPGFVSGPCQSLHEALAKISFKVRDNAPGKTFAIFGNAEFASIDFETSNYEVSVRILFANLEVKTRGCQIDPASKYRETVQDGKYARIHEQAKTRATENSRNAGLSVDGGIGSNGIRAKIGALVQRAWKGTDKETASEKTKQTPVQEIIQPIPVGFRLGLENAGDPRREVGDQTLDGAYPLPEIVQSTPMFKVDFEHGEHVAAITLTLFAPSSRALRMQSTPKPHLPSKGFFAVETDEQQGRREAVMAMKERILGLALLDEARSASALDPEMAIPLATQTIKAIRLPDEEPKPTQVSKIGEEHDEAVPNAGPPRPARRPSSIRKRPVSGTGGSRRPGSKKKLPKS